MAKPRSNPNEVKRMCGEYYGLYVQCVRDHWTCERYIKERGKVMPRVQMTREDGARVFGYSQAMFASVNGYALLEWRLGHVDPSPNYPDWKMCVDVTGSYPTHGAWFWRDTKQPWDEWLPLT